jgi:hypothetical protein
MYIQEGMRVVAECFDRRRGTVVRADINWVLVEFDDPFPGGHDGNCADGVGACRDGYGWWFYNRDDGRLTILSENDQEIGVANISIGFDELFQSL